MSAARGRLAPSTSSGGERAAGIHAVGWALPALAIKADEYRKAAGSFAARGVQEKTVAAFDEDEVTLAVEAGERALSAAPLPPDHVGYLAFASAGGARGSGALASLALGTRHAQAVDFLGAGPPFAAALFAALEFAESTARPALLLASDALRARPEESADHALGAGAAAFLVQKTAPVQGVGSAFASAAALENSRVGADGLVAGYLGDDPSPAALRMALAKLFEAGFAPDSFDVAAGPERGGQLVAMNSPAPLKSAQLPPAVFPRTGDTGAASAALALICALEYAQADDQLLLADAEGASGAAFAIKCSARPAGAEGFRGWLAEPRVHVSWRAYLGHRRYLPSPAPTHTKSEGAYVSAAAWEETLEERLGLIASRCRACGAARHPPRQPCMDCGSVDTATFHARPEGSVHALTRIGRGGSPSEFALQQAAIGDYAVAIVDMLDGFRLVAQVAACDPRTVKLGDAVRLRLRRLFEQEGRTRYGLKAVPCAVPPPPARKA